MLKIIIEGDPIAKKRARHVRRGAHVITYDLQKHEKLQVQTSMKSQITQMAKSDDNKVILEKISSAKSIAVSFVFHLPVSSKDPERNAKLWGFIPAIKKIDIDNIVKFYLDCANGVIWKDDSIVTNLVACKLYNHKPRTEITFMPLKEFEPSEFSKDIFTCFEPKELDDFLMLSRLLGDMVDKNMYELDIENRKAWIEETASLIAKLVVNYGDTLKKVKKKL